LYPNHWNISKKSSVQFLQDRTTDAHEKLGKPTYVGEYGWAVDRSAADVNEQLVERDRIFQRWYEAMDEAGTNGGLVWQLIDERLFGESDVFSVYYPKDASTISVIAEHSEQTEGSESIGETGRVTVAQRDPNEWHTIYLDNSYQNPVVLMQPVSSDGGDPVHARLRTVNSGSFEFQLEEWDYDDGWHTSETISYTVIEAGQYTLSDGTPIEVRTVWTDHTFTPVEFAQSFSTAPVVLTHSQTRNGRDAIVTRQQNISSSGVDVRVQEEEARGPHVIERVGYVAIEPGIGTNGGAGFEVGRTEDIVTANPHTIRFSQDMGGTPIFLAGMQTYNGSNSAGLRYRSLNKGAVDIAIDEEQSADKETRHTTEVIGYVVIADEGLIYAK